jgi:hypothetical protein
LHGRVVSEDGHTTEVPSMNRNATVMMLAAALLATGCATGAPGRLAAGDDAPAASPRTARAEASGPDGRCLPPGIGSKFFSWPVQSFHPLLIRREDASMLRAAWVLYRQGGEEVAALWGGEELLAVDPSPRTDTPLWVDAGLIDGDGKTVLVEPTDRCRWRREGGLTARAGR